MNFKNKKLVWFWLFDDYFIIPFSARYVRAL